ncbi:SDR family oxidoreductase [Rhodovulum sulfidophilum]|uniref:SDR family oxidoreductase n=1 Tax=Rhodovulum sulfidophilum TaxID=35806 RepID=A0A0D6AXT3_RHOSU|nr:SDR family oxidoreductase [Rhodovulum sulfidophilum]ANB33649.1 oxidoreductase [Rhodovulum sulfidophilum DSM 1374]ANB37470.1 oxidoreductase [Rhodovulum sulfidophilum]MBK5922410.1 NAD(P)-dependent oxidoreductase [Rhodovulum sulfidophilum]MBL3553025.1 SDR family oxidoreductase [Rhodovulum sulfidophilum]MBL3561528.1 SDR family oxidoreductase [Rhodovulum sulfidophilum]
MSFSIQGKTAIVTGAANGLGLAIARHFADRGANVMFADRDEPRLVDECGRNAEGDSAVRYFAGDLRERLTIANLLSATIDAFDRIDILVNASRQMVLSDPLDPDNDGFDVMMEQNVMTSLRLSQIVSRRMIRQAGEAGQTEGQAGAIVNMSSIAATRTHGELLAYSVSCAALEQLTRSMAVALAPHRIRVNGVAFGSVMSASLQNILKDQPDYRSEIRNHTPLGRIAKASELSETVQFLSSDAAQFMTGQILAVDGGRTLIDPVATPAH